MQVYKSNVNKQIDEIIKALELLKKQNDIMQIDFTAPHIVEIGGDSMYTYGIIKSNFEITYEGEYRKVNDLMKEWERVDK